MSDSYGTWRSPHDRGRWHIVDHDRPRADNSVLTDCQSAPERTHDDCMSADHSPTTDAYTRISRCSLVVAGADRRVLPDLDPVTKYSAAVDHDPETSVREVDVPFEPHLGLQDRPEAEENERLEAART